jgi:hypothetical protein
MAARVLQTHRPNQQGQLITEGTMTITTPDTGRITLTLKADTIKALRLLALLKDESQNDVAEALLIAGGLHSAVDNEWSTGQLKPTAAAPVRVMPTLVTVTTPTPQAPAPFLQVAPTLPKPASLRDGQMPEVPTVTKGGEDDPYLEEPIPW